MPTIYTLDALLVTVQSSEQLFLLHAIHSCIFCVLLFLLEIDAGISVYLLEHFALLCKAV